MAAYIIKGRILEIESQTREMPYADGTKFMHRRYLVIDDTRYNSSTGDKMFDNFPCFEFAGDNCEKLSLFKVGEKVEITFDIRGRKWINPTTGVERWFNTLSAYKIEPVEQQQWVTLDSKANQTQPQVQPQARPTQAPTQQRQQVQYQQPQYRQQVSPQYQQGYNQPPYQPPTAPYGPPIPGGEIYANDIPNPPLPFQPQPTVRKPVQKQVQGQEESDDLPF